MKTIIVCGGRNYSNEISVFNALDRIKPSVVVQGGASGADKISAHWCRYREVKCHTYPADWGKFGKAAGPIRNQKMIDEGRPDLVVAFPGGAGTANMIKLAKAAGISVEVIDG